MELLDDRLDAHCAQLAVDTWVQLTISIARSVFVQDLFKVRITSSPAITP